MSTWDNAPVSQHCIYDTQLISYNTVRTPVLRVRSPTQGSSEPRPSKHWQCTSLPVSHHRVHFLFSSAMSAAAAAPWRRRRRLGGAVVAAAVAAALAQLVWIARAVTTYGCGAAVPAGAASGVLATPLSPLTGLYPDWTRCAWVLRPPDGSSVSLSVTSLDVEGGVGCPYDRLTVWDGAGGTLRPRSVGVLWAGDLGPVGAPLVGSWCGTLAPFVVVGTADDGGLTVVFESDGRGAAGGVTASFTAVPRGACEARRRTPAHGPAALLSRLCACMCVFVCVCVPLRVDIFGVCVWCRERGRYFRIPRLSLCTSHRG